MTTDSSRSDPRHWRLGLIGHGAVGQALAPLLRATTPELRERHGITIAVGMVATRRGGVLVACDGAPPGGGIDLLTGREERADGTPGAPGAEALEQTAARVDSAPVIAIPSAPIDLVVEMTPLDRAHGEPATSHLQTALAHGIHAISVNKGPLALHGPELRAAAAAAGLGLRFEATLMDSLPALALRESIVPLGPIESFAAIVNSTSNFVLDAMADGRSESDAIAEAQRLGIAEADPRADLDGWDGAFKAAILAQLLLERDVRAGDVVRGGLSDVTRSEVIAASAAGQRLRVLARGQRSGGPVCVAPERVPAASLFGRTSGFSMALAVETRYAGRLEIGLVEPRVEQTAYAILMDILAIDRAVRAGDLHSARGWSHA